MFIMSGALKRIKAVDNAGSAVEAIKQANAPKNPTVTPEDYETPVSKGEYQNMLKTMYDNSKDPESKALLAKEIKDNRENGNDRGIKS